jgi:SAM-dependent methyltransferase
LGTYALDGAAMPRLAEFRQILSDRFRFFKDVVDRNAAAFGHEWAADFEEMLEKLFPTADALGLAAKGYAMFVLDLLRRQRKFDVAREYPAKTYAEAAAEVYFDDDYMMNEYLPGLLLSHYLWPHHYHQSRFFDSAFVSQMRQRGGDRFAEVGIGTGLYSRRLLQLLPAAHGTGFDISPSSKAFTEAHVGAFGLQDRYEVILQDVVEREMPPQEWLVCIEVLEHLEDPVTFLRALRGSLAPGGRAFITAALNAAHVDHIYLYETPEQVHRELRAAGFELEQSFLGAAYAPTTPDQPIPAVAAFIVF